MLLALWHAHFEQGEADEIGATATMLLLRRRRRL